MNPRPAAYEAAALPAELPGHKIFIFTVNKKLMIITEAIPFGVLKEKLDELNAKKIAIISCDSCAKLCETGGEEGLEKLKKKLEENGFEIIYTKVIPVMCNLCVEKSGLDFEKIKEADVLIPLSCDAGKFILHKLVPDKKIVTYLDTRGLGAVGENGEIFFVRGFD